MYIYSLRVDPEFNKSTHFRHSMVDAHAHTHTHTVSHGSDSCMSMTTQACNTIINSCRLVYVHAYTRVVL